MAQKRIFSEEEAAFIAGNIDGRRNAEMIRLIKEKFGKEISVKQFQNWRTNHGVKSKIELPGWKKGLKAGVDFKIKKQQKNFLPIGTERISVRGITEVKTGPLTWKQKHRIIWEEVNGPLPDDCCILFANDDKTDFAIENLVCITRRELAVLNKRKFDYYDKDTKETALLLTKIAIKRSDRRKDADKRKN